MLQIGARILKFLHVPMPNITSSSSTELVRVRKSLRRSILWRGQSGLGSVDCGSGALPFLVIEMLAIVQIVDGLFGNFAADAFARIASIEGTLDLRR